MKKAYFGAGCFWGVEAQFKTLEGVSETTVGYSGGDLDKPSYEQVCQGDTGHAEVVEVVYDPTQIKFTELVAAFFRIHDPTSTLR